MSKPSIAELLRASGHTVFTADLVVQAVNTLYGYIGAGLDERDWAAILASDDPLAASETALVTMYSDAAFLLRNANHLSASYGSAQIDYTYRQISERLGITHEPDWATGTRYESAAELDDSTVKSRARRDYEQRQDDGGGGEPDVIRITAQNANVTANPNTLQNATAVTTAGDDTIETQFTFLTGTTIDGGGGTDTLEVTDGGTFTLNNITNVEILDLTGANTASTVTDINTGRDGFATVNLSDQGDTITSTARQDFDINGGAGDDMVIYTALDDLFDTDGDPLNIRNLLDGGGGTNTLQVNAPVNDDGGMRFDRAPSFQRLVQNDTGAADITIATAEDLEEIDISASDNDSTVSVAGLAADFSITGGSGDDMITGGDGDDRITGGAGADTLVGGGGSDVFAFSVDITAETSDSSPTQADTITDFDADRDRVEITATGIGAFSGFADNWLDFGRRNPFEYRLLLEDGIRPGSNKEIALNLPTDVSLADASALTRLDLTGTDGADTLAGGDAADRFRGLAGDDRIAADENDRIDGGDGRDTVVFSAPVSAVQLTDADLLAVEVVELSGDLSAGVDLSAQSEALDVIDDDDDVTVILGNGGGDVRGKYGKDIFTAGDGVDRFIIHTTSGVGTDDPERSESSSGAYDEISDFDLANDRLHIVATDVDAFDPDRVIGGDSTDLPVGSAPNTREVIWIDINGSETFTGGGGNNDEGGDVFVYTPGLSVTSAEARGVVSFDMTGTGGDDIIQAGELDDTITGGAGADRLTGGAGADTFIQGNGDGGDSTGVDVDDNIVTFANGVDVIEDFSAAAGDVLQYAGGLDFNAVLDANEFDGLGSDDNNAALAFQGIHDADAGTFSILSPGLPAPTDILVAEVTMDGNGEVTDLVDAIILVGGLADYDPGTTIVAA